MELIIDCLAYIIHTLTNYPLKSNRHGDHEKYQASNPGSVSPIYGHITPILVVVKDLIARGFEVTVVSTSAFQEKVSDLGAKLVLIQGYGYSLWSDGKTLQGRMAMPSGIERLLYDMEHLFIAPIHSQHEAIQRAIAGVRKNDPGRPIILINESFHLGAIPMMMGAPGLKADGVIGISTSPLTLTKKDTVPFGPGLPPDSSPEGRKRNVATAKQTLEKMFKNSRARFRALLAQITLLDFFDRSKEHVGELQIKRSHTVTN